MSIFSESLIRDSLALLSREQHPNGAFLASPRFATYAYCWLRDGSFIAYALLKWNKADACHRFLGWVATTIEARTASVAAVEAALAVGKRPDARDTLPTRYTVEGQAAEDDWPNFQIDGYGAWLWLLDQALTTEGAKGVPERWQAAAELTLRYLKAVWSFPNYDCWEENGTGIHPATLACVYGGVHAWAQRTGRVELHQWAEDIRRFILASRLPDGRFPKSLGNPAAEASLLWLSLPFGVVEVDHPSMRATVARIATDLLRDGGVQRYAADTYYGGGRWVLLSSWLAWYRLRAGHLAEAEPLLAWVEAQAQGGELPEQVAQAVTDPAFLPVWEERWGRSASPLLWSHAMYLIALAEHPQFLDLQRRIS